MLDKVFEMFTQINRNLKRSQGGLGIGLALVRRLVAMHGGTIAVFSEGQGKGAEFIVGLPLADPGGARVDDQVEEGRATDFSPLRILVVDDNVDTTDSLSMQLSMSGHDVRSAYDGPSGIEQATSFKPHVILLDLGMPGMDGYETARKTRELPGGKEMALVALTGWGQEEDRRRTKEAGFDFHLLKTVTNAALEEVLAALTPVEVGGRGTDSRPITPASKEPV
jgi:two-component system CheB/CheR fusion protein